MLLVDSGSMVLSQNYSKLKKSKNKSRLLKKVIESMEHAVAVINTKGL